MAAPERDFSFVCKHYNDLSKEEFHEIIQARIEVFVVEQNCAYQDLDHKDALSWHLSVLCDGQLAAYARIVPPGVSYDHYSSIGRVISVAEFRGIGAGKILIAKAIEYCEALFPNTPIKISAQQYLLKFYGDFGFQPVGEGYIEDLIPHMAMIRPVQQ